MFALRDTLDTLDYYYTPIVRICHNKIEPIDYRIIIKKSIYIDDKGGIVEIDHFTEKSIVSVIYYDTRFLFFLISFFRYRRRFLKFAVVAFSLTSNDSRNEYFAFREFLY